MYVGFSEYRGNYLLFVSYQVTTQNMKILKRSYILPIADTMKAYNT